MRVALSHSAQQIHVFDFRNYYAPLLCSFLYQLLLKIYNPFICLGVLKQFILRSPSWVNYLKVDFYSNSRYITKFFFYMKLKYLKFQHKLKIFTLKIVLHQQIHTNVQILLKLDSMFRLQLYGQFHCQFTLLVTL